MRLFDEEVHVTLTNSNCNYITVESYEEIFFDVFEIEFGGKKYITEKVGTHNGYPVVSIPVSENNRTVEVEFVLKEGHTSEVLFNKSLAVVQKESLANYDIDDSIIIESVEEESSVDEIETVLLEHEQSDKIREGILRAKESGAKFVATAYADRIIKEKMNSLESSIDLKYANLQEYVDNAKAVLFEDFVKLVDVAKESITSSNQRDKEGIESSVRTQLSECILALESSLSDKQEEAVAKFDEKLTGIANEVLTTVLLPEVSERETKIKKSLSVDVDQRLKNLHESFNAELVSAKSGITTLEKINVEITDSLKKSSSKIDLVEKSLHAKLKEASKKIQLLVESETVKVTEYYNHKIELIEKDISNKLTSTDKEEIIALVESSKQSIISELASTQRDIPNIIIEKANGSKELNVNKLKSEVEKSISTSVTNKFSTEIQALKRLVEMSSGGGSVAKQFANGGTMNGNLTVTGAISASSYLGLVIPNPDLSQYLPLSGGTVTGDLTVVGKISATSNITTSGNVSASNYNPGANVATFLQTPTSDNLRAALTDDTGTGANVFADNATISSPTINTALTLNATTYTYGVSAREGLLNGLSNRFVYKNGLIPFAEIFDDFPTTIDSRFGTHRWISNSGTVAYYTNGGPTVANFWGAISLTTSTVLSSTASIYLAPTAGANGQTASRFNISFQTCFCASVSSSEYRQIFSGGGTSYAIAVIFNTGVIQLESTNIGGTGINTLTVASGLSLSTGNFVSGTRYRLFYKPLSLTQCEVYFASSPWNSSTWTTLVDTTVTHPSVASSSVCTQPFVTVTTRVPVSGSAVAYLDWVAIRQEIQR